MTNHQARLIAASLAMVAGAILCASRPDGTLLIIAAVLFVVEYLRSQLPAAEPRA